jgi:hypothetical protein
VKIFSERHFAQSAFDIKMYGGVAEIAVAEIIQNMATHAYCCA